MMGLLFYNKKIDNVEKISLINSKGEIITNQKFDYIAESINGFSMVKNRNIDYLISSENGKMYRILEILIQNKRNY